MQKLHIFNDKRKGITDRTIRTLLVIDDINKFLSSCRYQIDISIEACAEAAQCTEKQFIAEIITLLKYKYIYASNDFVIFLSRIVCYDDPIDCFCRLFKYEVNMFTLDSTKTFFIPKKIINDNNLYFTDKLVYSALINNVGVDFIARASYKELGKETNLSTRTVMRAVMRLEENNYIESKKRSGYTNEYKFI